MYYYDVIKYAMFQTLARIDLITFYSNVQEVFTVIYLIKVATSEWREDNEGNIVLLLALMVWCIYKISKLWIDYTTY